ncbi:MAG: putative glutamate/gamma-aminobutyrate antiporter [Acidimicrobiales bacterium]|nr:putative glutamate/gamma-aminobutyrate antiporter [Acidimicrobiales bacterium]
MTQTADAPAAPAGPPEGISPAVPSRRSLGVFILAMINVAAVLSLRNLPSNAEFGWQAAFWILLATVLFLVPLSLAGAELASGWPDSTGVFDWVREGFGRQSGFVAIWCEWVENVVWFPTVLSFLVSTLAFAFSPALANNRDYLLPTMIGFFWLITFLNFFGDRFSGMISSVGTILGSIIPGLLIVVLGVYWILDGRPTAIEFDGMSSLLPTSLDLGTLVFFQSMILGFAGMEMAGYHALETKNPQRDFPRAMFISAVIIFVITTLGTLAIAIVVPAKKIGLASGLMQAFQDFFDQLNVAWATRPMAILVFLGGFALISTWVIGPAKGLHGATREGLLPPMWGRENKRGVPVGVVVLQAALGTMFIFAFYFLGTNGGYWILTSLTTEIIAIMYVLIFTSVIRLRYVQPNRHRPYRIPGGIAGVWLLAGAGAISVTFAFILGFFKPSNIGTISAGTYAVILFVITAVAIAPPFIFYRLRKPSWLEASSVSTRFAGGAAAGLAGRRADPIAEEAGHDPGEGTS